MPIDASNVMFVHKGKPTGSATGRQEGQQGPRRPPAPVRRSDEHRHAHDRDRSPRAQSTRTTTTIKAQLQEQLGINNEMQIPKLEKIVINMGVGRATQQPSLLEGGRRPHRDRRPEADRHQASTSIAGFKLREGQAIGTKVTLRGDRMWEFFDRLCPSRSPVSATSAACRPRRGTAVATTRSASTTRPCSPRSTSTRSTPRAAWTSRS